MPRSNRSRGSRRGDPRALGAAEPDELDIARMMSGWRRTETKRGIVYNVQPITALQATKDYRCPGCGIAVDPGHRPPGRSGAPTACWATRPTSRPVGTGTRTAGRSHERSRSGAASSCPRVREDIELQTARRAHARRRAGDALDHPPVATLLTLHPLPTAGGFMDSHVLRKAAARLPALADLAVLRFNTRGTSSPRGTSEGEFGGGAAEAADVAAAWRFLESRGLPHVWLVGWSFGTELALKYGRDHAIDGAILLSPPLHRDQRRRRSPRWAPRRPAGSSRSCPSSTTTCGPTRRASGSRSVPEPRLIAVRGRQAPLGGGAADAAGARRDRARREPGGAAAADRWSPEA